MTLGLCGLAVLPDQLITFLPLASTALKKRRKSGNGGCQDWQALCVFGYDLYRQRGCYCKISSVLLKKKTFFGLIEVQIVTLDHEIYCLKINDTSAISRTAEIIKINNCTANFVDIVYYFFFFVLLSQFLSKLLFLRHQLKVFLTIPHKFGTFTLTFNDLLLFNNYVGQ